MMVARRLLLAACMLCVSAGLYAQEQKDEAPQTPAQQPQQTRVSHDVVQGLIIKKVEPKYPKEARKKRVQGAVVLQALIGKTGDVEDLHVVSGDELLVPAAMQAVRQWKYKPYLLKGQPVEVETVITLNFTLH